MRYGRTVLCMVFVLLAVAATAQEADTGMESADETQTAPWSRGLVFTTDSILLDIADFNGGVGVVLRRDQTAVRGAVGAFGSNSFNTIALKLGLWHVRYLWTGRVSPYWDVFGTVGTLSQKTETDADNWTRDLSMDLATGAALGAEFFLLDFLSVFAEYSLAFSASGSRTSTSVAATVTKDPFTWAYTAGTGLGHGGAIGVTLYFEPQVALPRAASSQ